MDKYSRNYRLEIEKRDGTLLTVRLPFTIEFDIHRNSFSSANVASIRVMNLNLDNRAQIQHFQGDTLDRRRVTLHAGYGQLLGLAFQGFISHAWSIREGTNFVTQIESFDGGLAYNNAINNSQYSLGTTRQSMVENIAGSMNIPAAGNVTLGAIGSFPGSLLRGNSFNGPTLSVLSDMIGGPSGVFIDNNKINILNDRECVAGDALVINSRSGLLGTPLIEDGYIMINMLFEPSLIVGQLVNLQTLTGPRTAITQNGRINVNGIHKVLGFQHQATISAAVCGDATTMVKLLPGNFTEVQSRS